MAELLLPVSVGEGLDKLTILDIKCDKIKDGRRADCKKEYDALYEKLAPYMLITAWHIKILKEINLKIWDLQDATHGATSISPLEVGKIYTQVLEENDRRFRMKAKINHALTSSLKEQKSYAKKKVFFYGHLGLGDMFWLNGAVRYFSTCYEEVVVVCKEKYAKNVALMYQDDPTIQLCVIQDDYVLYPFQQEKRKYIEGDGYVIKACGYHSENPRIYEFPHCFYDDLGLDRTIRTSYFYIPTLEQSKALLNEVQSVAKEYCVIHQQSQNKTMPLWGKLYEEQSESLLLDINTNHYPDDHMYYEIAQKVVGQPLVYYKDLLEHATEIHLLESSLYCLASHLDLSRVKVKHCYDAFDHSNERLGIFSTATL